MKDIKHFINRAKKCHGNKYDYTKTKYVNSRTHVEIICPVHGSFYQTPFNHYKYGCKHCGHDNGSIKQRKFEHNFLEQATNIHKKKYKYISPYISAHEKITIECPIHGEFKQTPNSHLRGRGCPKCKLGILHPCFGKSSRFSTGYYGKYNGNTFRSFSELFWMLSAEEQNIEFLALDQHPNRKKWQVFITINNKPTTYCPDFFIYSTNKVIDIKPTWRIQKEKEKLDIAKIHYESLGILFETVDCNTIKIDYRKAFALYEKKQISLYPAAEAKLLHRMQMGRWRD